SPSVESTKFTGTISGSSMSTIARRPNRCEAKKSRASSSLSSITGSSAFMSSLAIKVRVTSGTIESGEHPLQALFRVASNRGELRGIGERGHEFRVEDLHPGVFSLVGDVTGQHRRDPRVRLDRLFR